MSFTAATAQPLASRLHRSGGRLQRKPPVSTAVETPWIRPAFQPVMLTNILGSNSHPHISTHLRRRGVLSVPVAAFMLASVFSVGQGSAMAGELPVDENSDEVTKSGVATFNTSAARASQPLDNEKRFKVVHFVRHGEGYHNIGYEGLEDTHLTANGWSQASKLQKHINALKKPLDLDVVIVSPLFRTLETASGVFGGGTIENGNKVLMAEQMPVHNEVTRHYAIAQRPGVRFIANEMCRERMSLNRCDRRRNLTETTKNFPGVDFALIQTENDVMWDKKHDEAISAGAVGSRYFIGEKGDAVADRGVKFVNWVLDRPEKHVGVVSHCAFLHETLSAVSKDSPPELAQVLSRDFRNCEMRSVVFNREGKPVEILNDTYYPGGAPRYYLFPLNWAKQAVGSLAGAVNKRVNPFGK